MRLHLETPRELGAAVAVYDPSLRPDDDDWMLSLLLGGALGSVQGAQAITTDRGWPATVIEAVVDGGEAILGVFYQFLCYAAAVIVRAPHDRDEVVRVLASARPDFSGGEPVAMIELVGRD